MVSSCSDVTRSVKYCDKSKCCSEELLLCVWTERFRANTHTQASTQTYQGLFFNFTDLMLFSAPKPTHTPFCFFSILFSLQNNLVEVFFFRGLLTVS